MTPWTPRERALYKALEATPCRCSKAIKNACPACGETLIAVKPSPYLNSYQWDAIKAGDWFCNTCADASIGNGKKHWHDRELETITYQQCGRCAALADPPPTDPRDAALRCSVCHGTGIERSGVCHCGAEMDGHSVYDNHGALEMVRPCEFCTAALQLEVKKWRECSEAMGKNAEQTLVALSMIDDGIKQSKARIEIAEKALESIRFECDGKADVEDDDSGIANRPNLAMRVEMIAEAALAAIAAAKGEK